MELFFKKHLEGIAQEPLLEHYVDFKPGELSLTELGEFQRESVKQLVIKAYTHNPFYRQKMEKAGVKPEDIQDLDDITKLPFTTKDELRGNPWVLLAAPKEDVCVFNVSTGTTGGEESYIMQTWRDYFLNSFAAGAPKLLGIKPGDICINALPYEMSSAGLAFHKVFMEVNGATVVPAGKGGVYSTPEKTVRVIRDLQPTVLMTSPSNSILIAEAAAEVGFDLHSLPWKKIWLTGEGCSPAFRERVEKIYGAKANFYYGSLECGALGIECDAHAGYHIPLGHVYLEIIDPKTGEVLEPGEIGEIVATHLLRFDSPIIRYRTQDLGYIVPDTCDCGIDFPRFFLRGRLVDHLTVRGINFSPYYLEEFVMKQPEVGNWYQFVIKEGNNEQLKVRLELASGVQPSAELTDKISSKLEFAIGVPCEVEIVSKIPRPRAKTVRVVHE